MNSRSLEQKIGQLFVIGFTGDILSLNQPIAKDITKNNLGGVILFDRCLAASKTTNNIVSNKQLIRLTAKLQELGGNRLLIAVDQEGGHVNRFGKQIGFVNTPNAETLGSSPGLRSTTKSAKQTAKMLRAVGINLNLAPVVDLNIYKKNPIIGAYGRSFSADATKVCDHARAWIKEHKAQGILSCLKHFPGHGSSCSDSHLGLVDITETWQETELQPYQHLIRENVTEIVMLGHLFNANIDKKYPATLSRITIQSLLRNRLDYRGVIISDDMQMKAITNYYGLEKACCKAIAAGVDLIIIGNNLDHDPYILAKVQEVILKGIENNTISKKRIDQAWNRVSKLKKTLQSMRYKERCDA